MILNLKGVLLGHVNRLRYIKRFSTCRVDHPESVAEHSYYTCLYTMLICEWIRLDCLDRNGYVLSEDEDDAAEAMRRATMHDVEESRSGDVPRGFKYSRPELAEALKAAGHHAITDVVGQWGDTRIADAAEHCWTVAKNEERPGRIVAFADYLSALGHILLELESCNFGMLEHIEALADYHASFKGSDYNFIRPLVAQAGLITREIFARASRLSGKPISLEHVDPSET